MSRLFKFALFVVLAFAVSIPAAFAAEMAPDQPTVVDIAVSDGRFDTLVAAVVAADLADELSTGNWTVFAPTDNAFAKLGLSADNIAQEFTPAQLQDILLYHVLPTPVSAEAARASTGDIRMANGDLAGLKLFQGSLYINEDSRVIIPDIQAANGVIHVVDTVIVGPWPRDAQTATAAVSATPSGNTIVDIAVSDGRFETLVAAVVAAGLADELSAGSWTVFAPTDDAFARLGLNAGNIADEFTAAELQDILLYHVLTSPVTSTVATANQGDITMANGKEAGIKYFEGSLYVNDDARVIIPDIVTENGVIHVVDTVILGPWPR